MKRAELDLCDTKEQRIAVWEKIAERGRQMEQDVKSSDSIDQCNWRIARIEVEVLRGDWRRAVDPKAVTARLRADANHEIRAVLVVQVDTASGVVNDIARLRKAVDDAGHPALLLVDTIASLGTMPL